MSGGLSGAEYLASIFGTEKDRVNCSFFFKIGACRHGDKCSRLHNKPTFSQTILLQNLYNNPTMDLRQANAAIERSGTRSQTLAMQRGPTSREGGVDEPNEQQHFDDFFEEVFVELESKYGEIEEMNVCDNLGEHMIGNVYVKFRREEDAMKACDGLNARWFGGAPIYAELSPVTDFREACCRQYEMGECSKGGFCNFMHLKPISSALRRRLYGARRGSEPTRSDVGSFRDGRAGQMPTGARGWGGRDRPWNGPRSRSRSRSPRRRGGRH